MQDTLLQTWEALVNENNCAECVDALTQATNKKILPILKKILDRYRGKLDNGKLLYQLITTQPTAKDVRSVLLAHLMKLSRD